MIEKFASPGMTWGSFMSSGGRGIGDLQKNSVFLLTTVEEVLRYVHDKTMLYLSEEVVVQMVVSIGRAMKSSKKARWKIPKYFQ